MHLQSTHLVLLGALLHSACTYDFICHYQQSLILRNGPSMCNKWLKICQQQDKHSSHLKKTLENWSTSWLVLILLIPRLILGDWRSQKNMVEESAASNRQYLKCVSFVHHLILRNTFCYYFLIFPLRVWRKKRKWLSKVIKRPATERTLHFLTNSAHMHRISDVHYHLKHNFLESNYELALCLGSIPEISNGTLYACQFCEDRCTIDLTVWQVGDGSRVGEGENSNKTVSTTCYRYHVGERKEGSGRGRSIWCHGTGKG